MPANFLQQKEYSTKLGENQVVLPRTYEISGNDSVLLLSQIAEEMDYTRLYMAYSSLGRKSATPPKTLFKIVVYAYMNQIYSSRKIAKACRRDLNFIWLLGGKKPPSHSEINRFRKNRLGEVVEDLFFQLVWILHELGEVRFEDVFQDGTKIEANANRYSFVWRKSVEKNEAKMFVKINALAEELNKMYSTAFTVSKDTVITDIGKMTSFLEQKKKEENIEFVSGTGKRKSKIQKQLEELYTFRKRQEGYNKSNALFDGRGSYSKTDTDATFMRMKDDHMKNGQLKPGYNVQLAIEAEYIIGAGIFPNCNDLGTMVPVLNNVLGNIRGKAIKRFTGDSGYESEENYTYLEGKGIAYYIKPQTYEQQKKKSFKDKIGKRENMAYNVETDEYTCHNGKKLRRIGVSKKTSSTGFKSEVTIYECEGCEGCPYKAQCTKAKGNRRIEVSKTFIEQRQKSYENITSDTGVLLRINRSIQSEGAFGILKEDRQFRRFLTRGKANVTTEILLLCIAYNVNKLHAKIQAGRCGKPLHELKSA